MSLQNAVPLRTSPPPAADLGRLTALLARFEALFETVPLALAIFDEALQLVRANTRFHELTTLDVAQGYGRSIYDAFPNALADCSDLIEAALRGGPAAGFTHIAFQLKGGRRIVEATFAAISEEFGAKGVLFIATDVTEREQLRADLARSASQMQSFFDVIPDSVRVFDATGAIIRSNTQAQRDHEGHPPATLAELWQQDRPRMLDGTTIFLHEHPAARALEGDVVRGETLAVRRGAEGVPRVIEMSSNPLHDAQGNVRGVVTVERDVTERTRLAQELEQQVRRSAALYERVSTEAERLERMVRVRTEELLRLQEAQARARRLAAIGQLAAGVMHDVNNALNPIMAAAYLLEAHADDPRAVREFAARIARAADTGAATAARVGRFIRQEPLEGETEETFDLAVLADEVIAMTHPLWAERTRGGRVQLERDFVPGTLVRGIAGEMREALLNLVQNALDAMPQGGTLGIATRMGEHEVCVEVRDTGTGMTDEVRERACEPFFTTKGRAGTGLGLSEVYGIVKRHRGRVELESAPGRGTVVRLTFPLAASLTPAERAPAVQRAPCRILVVEDNDDGREFMQALLEFEGHLVDSVATVHDAMARLAGEGGSVPYDVLLTDIGLPDGSGWDIVAQARARWPRLRIGVVTGWELRTGVTNGADFTLRKPVRTQDLLARIAGDV